MRKVILIIFLIPTLAFSQNLEIKIFENFTGKKWKAEGKWGDGSNFKQEIAFSYSLDSTIVISNTMGFTDKQQTKFGLRNHGVRMFDKKSGP